MSFKAPSTQPNPSHPITDLMLQVKRHRAATTARPGLRKLCQGEFSVRAFPVAGDELLKRRVTQLIKTPLENKQKLLGCTSGHIDPAGRSNVGFVGMLNDAIPSSRSGDGV